MSDDPESPAPQLTASQQWVNAVCTVTGWDWHIKRNSGRAARLGRELREAGATVTELVEHYGQRDCGAAWWWYRDQWQGRRYGQRPTPAQIMETWGAWKLPIAVAREPAGFDSLRQFLGAENVDTGRVF